MPVSTWDSANDYAGSYSLTGGDLQANRQVAPAGNWASILNTLFRSVGKHVFEVRTIASVQPSSLSSMIGVQNATVNVVTTYNYPGIDTNGIGFTDWACSFQNAVQTLDTPTFAGRHMSVAVDLDDRKVWLGVNMGTGTTWDRFQSRRTTTDPTTATYRLTFPSGWLGAQWLSGTGNSCVRSTSFRRTGKYYVEYVVSNPAAGIVTGLLNGALDLVGTSTFPGAAGNNGYGYFSSGGLYRNGAAVVAMPSLASGDRVSVAVDLDNMRIWFRKTTGDWNLNASADPATNTGGLDLTGLAAPYYMGTCVTVPGEIVTMNFGASAFTYAVPSGFTAWDDGVVRMLWNNSDDLLAQDPANGVGGYDISGVTGALAPTLASVTNALQSGFGYFAAADLANPLPSGFTAWDDDNPPPLSGRYTPLVMPM